MLGIAASRLTPERNSRRRDPPRMSRVATSSTMPARANRGGGSGKIQTSGRSSRVVKHQNSSQITVALRPANTEPDQDQRNSQQAQPIEVARRIHSEGMFDARPVEWVLHRDVQNLFETLHGLCVARRRRIATVNSRARDAE